ncbi:MAG: glutamate--tRNA ligase [Thermoprotei archaeon]|nr:MAG: glutamate--tRNA ligase [Thermoprotei archaeon]RLF22735.1 MAG: glutamate--tRNA ligase [Thermoprotei archaeon]
MSEELRRIALKYALVNAIKHGGKANKKAVIGKIIAEKPEVRKVIKQLLEIVSDVVAYVNNLSLEEQKKIFDREFKEELIVTRKEAREELPPLPGVEDAIRKYGRITTRFAPAPTGAIHIGQFVRAAMLSYLYARKYKGRVILRIEDTDPKKIKRIYYDWIIQDLKEAGFEWDELVIISDHFPRHYEVAEELIRKGRAYVCTCSQEQFRLLKEQGVPCPCRSLSTKEHLRRWEGMLNGEYSEGEAVVRLRTDMAHPNPALRDPPLLRIIESVPHPRTGFKYRVYPLYNFACAIEDHDSKVTHILRAKEHEHNAAIQGEIYRAMGWDPPIAIQYGMIYLEGFKVHKRYIREGLIKGELMGWDDIRLPTIRALLRRGIQPEALKKLAIHCSLTPHDIKLSMETLYTFNRQIIDPVANRYYYVEDPMLLIVRNAPLPFYAKIRLHPNHPERGFKEYRFFKDPIRLYISRRDLGLFSAGSEIRLLGLFNIKPVRIDEDKIEAVFSSIELKKGIPKVHWVSEPYLHAVVLKPDGSVSRGYAEIYCQHIKPGEIVQFERYAFVRLEANEGELLRFVFTHE